MPAKQLVHAVVPAFAENLPSAQDVHDDDELAPVVATNVPAAQLTHADDPVLDANWPVTQDEHKLDEVAPEIAP
jgi:hypothetical protein